AIEAQRPVQICLICYVNQPGELDMVAPFVTNISFAVHVKKVLEMPKVIAHLVPLPAIATEGHTVESLTRVVQEKMQIGLVELQSRVLKKPQEEPVLGFLFTKSNLHTAFNWQP